MEIIKKEKSISVSKKDGTDVSYYIFPEYEIHYNELAPGAVQQWHHHPRIEETLIVVSGEMEVRWIDGGEQKCSTIGKGDVVRVENTPHTFANPSRERVVFVVYRMVPDGTDKRDIIKNDKVIDQI
jgi:mannose-6-phosphate isomerase-like protein (cupin superfamily)